MPGPLQWRWSPFNKDRICVLCPYHKDINAVNYLA